MIAPADGAALLDLARGAVAAAARGGSPPDARRLASLPAVAHRPGAAFVTLSIRDDEDGPWRLRGCIGTVTADRPLGEAVAEAARNAALDDPRFPPLAEAELPRLRVSVTVMGPIRAVPSAETIDVARHGVVLERDGRRALFLPQVARETGWDRYTLLARLAAKAGLAPEAWRGARLSVFDATSFGGD